MLVWKDKRGGQMVRNNFTPEQIINKLREAEIHINRGYPYRRSQSEDWHHRADLLPLAKRVWWPANRTSEEAQESRKREYPA